MKAQREGINALAVPSGTGCVECLATGSWWFHLRRCAHCGHIGCCDSSPNQHGGPCGQSPSRKEEALALRGNRGFQVEKMSWREASDAILSRIVLHHCDI